MKKDSSKKINVYTLILKNKKSKTQVKTKGKYPKKMNPKQIDEYVDYSSYINIGYVIKSKKEMTLSQYEKQLDKISE